MEIEVAEAGETAAGDWLAFRNCASTRRFSAGISAGLVAS
jgi:hypothetical protein